MEEDKLNIGEKQFEIKQEYLDDLNQKLDKSKYKSIRNKLLYILSISGVLCSLCFFTIDSCIPSGDLNKNKNIAKIDNTLSIDKNENQTGTTKNKTTEQIIEEEATKDSKSTFENLSKSDVENNDSKESNGIGGETKTKNKSSGSTKFTSKVNQTPIKPKVKSTKPLIVEPAKPFLIEPKKPVIKPINSVEPKDSSEISKVIEIEKVKKDDEIVAKVDSSEKEVDETEVKEDSPVKETNSSSVSEDSAFANTSNSEIQDTDSASALIDSTKVFNDTLINKPLDSGIIANKMWRISLLAGSNTSFSKFSNGINQAYFLKRKEEKTLTGFSGGIMISKGIGKRMLVTTGLNYSTYGSNNNYSPTDFDVKNSNYSSIDTITSYNMDSMYYLPTRSTIYYINSTDTSYDSIYNTHKEYDSTAYNSRGKTKFSYIEIPLMIGYYKSFNKWNIGINTGVSIGLLIKESGSFIGEDRTSVLAAKSSQIMFNYMISPDIEYKFYKNYYIGFQPFFKFGLNDLSISTNEPVHRTYNSFQLNAKISYRF